MTRGRPRIINKCSERTRGRGFTLNKIKNIGRSKNQRLSDTASLLISFGKIVSAVNKAASRWSFT